MKPLDPRLLSHAAAARWFLVAGGALGLAQTLTIVAVAWYLSAVVVAAIGGESLQSLAGTVALLAGAIILRAGLSFLAESVSAHGAAAVKRQLRSKLLDGLTASGVDRLAQTSSSRVASIATTGLDALDGYFSRYLPQLILTVIATPIIVTVMFIHDLESGIIVIVVLPLIPVFMVLIGLATRAVQREQWESLQRLSSGFLDVVGGLATLKIFGRDKRQIARVAAVSDEYRTRTMAVLRVSFLSGFVLELAASLSVAIVAVAIGLRLVDGSLGLGVGLFVLLLAPEAFLPLRQVGAQFHAASDGLAAASEVFELIEPPTGSGDVLVRGFGSPLGRDPALGTRGSRDALTVSGLRVVRGGIPVIDGLDIEFLPGELSVIAGRSGVGKSTLLEAIRGVVPYTGTVSAISTTDIAWAGQRPGLLGGTVAANVSLSDSARADRLTRPESRPGSVPGARPDSDTLRAVRRALWSAGAGDLDPATPLGVSGDGLSGGQAQRVAVARALYRARNDDCAVVLLDEPSSALDPDAEVALIAGLRELANEGRIVIVVSHRPALIAAADRVVRLAAVSRQVSHA